MKEGNYNNYGKRSDNLYWYMDINYGMYSEVVVEKEGDVGLVCV